MRIALLLLLWLAAPALAQPAFHAPPVPAGSLTLRLHPTEAVAAGVPVRVTFGVP